eukprot:gnl/MRDRNA2_/MRDRNA2_70215_c0_seq1.p1 gnl/MRDRNA2_/MRDRNA2_70215_c0~~gnl/MRDRNA2_/MRDRNA2_70215_c0_seq1.p1  ORF type:complete len:272 (+),score=42.64 gnl/MRDRNA2_/MRDRNA2_70215_c0_seq1:490-1305(+)
MHLTCNSAPTSAAETQIKAKEHNAKSALHSSLSEGEAMAPRRLSVMITASHVPSHPSAALITEVIKSLGKINLPQDTTIILAHDHSHAAEYKAYLANLRETLNERFVLNVRDRHGHLTGNIRDAFKHVSSQYVLILQHDLPFIEHLDIQQIMDDMDSFPKIKHVRFNRRANIKVGFDGLNDLFGQMLNAKHYTYTRTPGWSDQNHLCLAQYYRTVVFRECKDGDFMENFLHGKCVTEKDHARFGTYLFGRLGRDATICHTDGRFYSHQADT